MLSFLKKKSAGNRLAVVFGEGRVDLVRIERRTEESPAVKLAESVERGVDDAATLAALRKSMGLNAYACTTLLTHGQYQMIQTDAPDAGVPADEAREMLRWKIKDMVDFPVDAAAIDLLPIPEGRSAQVFAAIAPESAMTQLVQSFQSAKVPLAIVDLPELSQRNLAALFEEENRGLALLIFDDAEGMLTFTFGGELYVVRHVEISARQLVTADGDRRANLFERIGLDVQRSLDNFDRAFSQIPLSKVLVAQVPGADGFIEYLRANLLLPVEVFDLASRLDLSATPALLDPVRQFQCLRALGAALREEPAA